MRGWSFSGPAPEEAGARLSSPRSLRSAAILLGLALAACSESVPPGGVFDSGARDAPDAPVEVDPGPPCERDADCAGSICRAPRSFVANDLAPLPLGCGGLEAGAPVGAPCAVRADCDRGICALAGACVAPCATDDDCPAGDRCREVFVETSLRSMQPVRACTAILAAAPTVRAAAPEPGPVLRDGLWTDELSALDPGALVVWSGRSSATFYLTAVHTRAEPPAQVVDVFDRSPEAASPVWGVSPSTISSIVTLLYPNGPATPVSDDGFRVSFQPERGALDPERTVLTRPDEGRAYDIDAYVVGVDRWSRGGGVPPELATAIEETRRVLAPVGLTVGEVRVHRVVGSLARQFGILDGEGGHLGTPPELAEMLAWSAGARRPSVHVFFVRAIDGALGVAAGIPGAHAMPGTGASGVAIAADFLGGREIGVVIAHEVGHFLGLFHTSEANGAVFEPLTDTLECRLAQDANEDGFLLESECATHGADNVMFWAGNGTRFSEQQGAVMRRGYFVR